MSFYETTRVSDGTDTLAVNADGSINVVGTLNTGDVEIGAVEIKNGSDDTRATVTASNELKVLASAQPGTDIGDVTINNASGASAVNVQDGGNSLTVDGTVAATQSGTWTEANSASIKTAVEVIDNFISGSRGLVTEDNSAAIAASLSVMDDWDETDRAKVNIIAGQVGVAGGSGTSSALTQRVTLATDIALPTGTNSIGQVTANAGSANIVIDSNNSTTATLTAGSTYTGTATDVSAYQQINIDIYGRPGVVAGDGSSAKASFFFEFSKDGTNWDVSVPSLVRDPSLVIPTPVINIHKYFRTRYLNDGGVSAIAALGLTDISGTPTAQTTFRLTTYLLPIATKELTRTMDQSISGSDPAQLVRAGIMGRNPAGGYVNVNTSTRNDGTVALEAETRGGDKTFFGSQFVEEMYDNVSINFATDIPAALTTTTLVSGGTATQSAAQAVLTVSSSTTSSAKMTSRSKVIYRPGHECRADFTYAFTTGATGCNQIVGPRVDTTDGFAFGYQGATFGVFLFNNGSTTFTAQSSWNGNISSQFTRNGLAETFDPTKANVYRIRYGLLGNAGAIFEIMSPDGGGEYALAHAIKNPNTGTSAVIQTFDLPMTAEVTKTSGSGTFTGKTSSWRGGAMGYVQEGATSRSNFSVTALTAGSTVNGTYEPVIGFTSISIIIATDQVSATNGIVVSFSDDGTTTRRVTSRTFNATDVVNGSKFFAIPVNLAYFKVDYTNGGTNQGSFFLQAILNTSPVQQSVDAVEASLSANSSATMVRSIMAAANDSGVYDNVKRGTLGGSRVSVNQHEVETPIKALAGFKVTRTGMTTTAAKVVATPFTNRRSLAIRAICSGSAIVYIGSSSGVTAGNGHPLSDGQAIDLELDDTVTEIWGIASTGTQAVSVAEVST